MTLQPVETLLAAALVLLLGHLLNRLIAPLARYNIPEPITGGLLLAIVLAVLEPLSGLSLSFDSTLKPILLLTFFAAVGLSADLSLLGKGGKRLLLFVLVLIPFLLLQNALGILLALGLDMHPLMGLVGGSITLIGGHGTGAAYAQTFAEQHNIQSVMELSMTAATLGLVLGGITGGPLAQWLIKRHQLAGAPAPSAATPGEPDPSHAALSAGSFLPVLAATLAAVLGGQAIAELFANSGVTLPSFLWCLLLGVLIRNLGRPLGLQLNAPAIEFISSLNLSLFLAITMMALSLSSVFALAGPLLLILLCQAALVLLFGALLTFRAVGRDYEAAVMSAAFCGFAMGATATAIANMQAIAQRYGPAPQAFVVVPLVGAFLIDLLNALVLTGFISLSWIGG
ncbi:sodium/glutamate symporter [Pseudomonas sp. N040]|uniref:sodium/glutamate symporter n=1 Tax=Pseudomonas sp. N040 TaxID=2785325 RepID=UPI0018A3385E|nr:sodium/glutamate symporter [Pseudomonas sp. N040]MBF7731684.1 sodium/glutamate symporter [Pseudomonas sp. N040]MBW7015328.1 sodium/glutamate symporter [Pseudomonas sp. N040]